MEPTEDKKGLRAHRAPWSTTLLAHVTMLASPAEGHVAQWPPVPTCKKDSASTTAIALLQEKEKQSIFLEKAQLCLSLNLLL